MAVVPCPKSLERNKSRCCSLTTGKMNKLLMFPRQVFRSKSFAVKFILRFDEIYLNVSDLDSHMEQFS